MKLIISVVVYKTQTIELEQVFKFIPDGLKEIGYQVHILDNANDG
jgi:hypothetical protein